MSASFGPVSQLNTVVRPALPGGARVKAGKQTGNWVLNVLPSIGSLLNHTWDPGWTTLLTVAKQPMFIKLSPFEYITVSLFSFPLFPLCFMSCRRQWKWWTEGKGAGIRREKEIERKNGEEEIQMRSTSSKTKTTAKRGGWEAETGRGKETYCCHSAGKRDNVKTRKENEKNKRGENKSRDAGKQTVT